MYVRTVDDQPINLQVSGMLWQRSLVMQDEESESKWAHLLGKCMAGKHKGKTLKAIPSIITDWKTWKTDFPKTDAMIWPLPRTRLKYDSKFYSRGMKHFVVGIAVARSTKAYPYDELEKQNLVNDSFKGVDLVVWFEKKSGAAWTFDRKLDGQVLEFELKEGKVHDKQTGSTWNLRKGICVDGDYKGKQLDPIIGIPSFRKAWNDFHPKSEYWSVSK